MCLGRPELYIMDADGTNAEVLTNYETANGTIGPIPIGRRTAA